MTRHSPYTRGFTLIELMVSLVIGLVISLAAVSAYIGASRASAISEVQSVMNEDAQMALSILAQHIRLAGSNPVRPNRLTPPASNLRNPLSNAYAVRGCRTTFSNIGTATSASALTCSHTASNSGPDSISVGYEADIYNTLPTAASVPTDCMGSALPASSATVINADGTTSPIPVYEAENRFYIGTSTDIVNPTLYCKGNATSAQPLVEGVEDLQIKYGTFDPAAATKAVLGYLNAYELESDTTTLNGLSNAAKWGAVGTVRICIVMRSPDKVATGTGTTDYLDCAGHKVTSTDSRLRRAYTVTVALRNNL